MDEDKFRDLIIRHKLGADKLAKPNAAAIVRLLNRSEEELIEKIASRYALIQSKGFDRGPATTKKLEDMLEAIRGVNSEVYGEIAERATNTLIETARNEMEFTAAAAVRAGIDYQAIIPDTAFLRMLVTTTPIPVDRHGAALLGPWVTGMEEGRFRRLENSIRSGLLQGETTDDLVKRIRGTKAANYTDGLLDISRQSAQTFSITANAAVQNAAREEAFKEMKSVRWVEWSSILDSRTSTICQSRSGQVWPLNEPHPSPPAHPRCRSLLLPRRNGTDSPKHKPYTEWLPEQPEGVQDEVLGKERADLFRAGKLTREDLYRDNGTFRSIEELKAHDRRILAPDPVPEPVVEKPRFTSPINPDVNDATIEVKPRKQVTSELNQQLGRNATDPRYDPRPEFRGIKPEMFGKSALPTAFSDEAASATLAIMPELDTLADAFNVPRIRAIRAVGVKGGAVANMGDGTLGLNPAYWNGYSSRIGSGSTEKITGKIDSLKAEMEGLAMKLKSIKDAFDLAKAEGRTDDYFAAYAEQQPLVKRYHQLSKKHWDAINVSKKSDRAASDEVSTWKPGDDVAKRPHTVTSYFSGIDRMRSVMYHEFGHHVHQMRAKVGRRSVATPPVERHIRALFAQRFHKLGEGRELKARVASTYATTNAEEWFAENFSAYMMGRRDLVEAPLIELIERMLDEK